MNNTPVGTAPNQYPPLLVKKLMSRPYTPLIKQIYGQDVFTKYTPRQIFEIWGEAIAAFEASGEICQFSSKYDASKYGVPAQNLYKLSASEERGRQLYFGRPNAPPATRRWVSPASRSRRRGRTLSRCTASPTSASPRIRAIPITRRQIPSAIPRI